MRRERILVVAGGLGAVRSGVDTYARLLVTGLRDRGWAVTVATDPAGIGAIPGVDYVALSRSPWDPSPGGWLSRARSAGSLGARLGAVLVHFADAREALWHTGPPAVGTVHDAYALAADDLSWAGPDRWRRRLYYGVLRRLEKRAYRRTALLLANSHAVRRALVAGYSLSPLRIRVLRLTVPLPPAVPPVRLAGHPSVLTAGQNLARKGLGTMLRALQHSLAALPGVHLHVVGGERQQRYFGRLARTLGVADRVTFHPSLPRERLLGFVAGADCVTLASHTEGYGLLLLEAMALGTPVVGGRAGGTPELVRDGVNGLLVSPGDARALVRAWRRLATDAALRTRLVRGGEETARRHHPERLLVATERVYTELLGTPQAPVWAA